MVPSRKAARIAGVFYLTSAAAAGFPLLYVPGLIVPGDPTATAAKVLSAENVFRGAMASEMLGEVLFLLLVLALYRLLSSVSKANASLMVVLAVVPVPIVFLNIVNEIATRSVRSSSSAVSSRSFSATGFSWTAQRWCVSA